MIWRQVLPPLVFLFIVALGLEFAASAEFINPNLVPPPHLIWAALLEDPAGFTRGFLMTARATLLGFALAVVIGFCSALLLSLIEPLRRAVLPFAIFFQTVPIIAVAPLLVIYFGFGLPTVVVASAAVAMFPVLANTLLGLSLLDPGHLELMRVYGATPTQILLRLRLPGAYPSIYAGLKIAAGLSVIGTVAGEFVAGGGLGAIVDSARTQQRTDTVFAALMLLSLLGLLMVGALRAANYFLNLYRPYGLNLKDT